MARFKNFDWDLPSDDDGKTLVGNWDAVAVAVLMDIRYELKRLNALLHCENFIRIPRRLEQIARNTTKSKRKKKP